MFVHILRGLAWTVVQQCCTCKKRVKDDLSFEKPIHEDKIKKTQHNQKLLTLYVDFALRLPLRQTCNILKVKDKESECESVVNIVCVV